MLFMLSATFAFSQSPISLSWSPSTDNVGVAGYCVWVDGERYDSTVNTQYDFPVFEAGEYWLTVSAYDAAGNESAQSIPLHVIIDDVTRPAVPEIITVEYYLKSARVTWVEPEDNIGIAGYNIYLDGVLLETTRNNRIELNDLTPEEQYRLSISAFDEAGNESYKSTEFLIILPEDELEITTYPNPSNGNFYVKFANGKIKDNSMIQILNISGQIMYQVIIPDGTPTPLVQEMNLADILTEGSYVISLIENNVRVQSLRLIISKNYLYQTNKNEFGLNPYDVQPLTIPIEMSLSSDEKK